VTTQQLMQLVFSKSCNVVTFLILISMRGNNLTGSFAGENGEHKIIPNPVNYKRLRKNHCCSDYINQLIQHRKSRQIMHRFLYCQVHWRWSRELTALYLD